MQDTFSDILFHNGSILSLDDAHTQPDALLVRGDKIMACGDVDTLKAQAAPGLTMVDLEGRALLPGFHDSHVHLTLHGLELARLNFTETETLEQALAAIAEQASRQPAGTWILGAGFSVVRWGRRTLDKADLDRITPNHPVMILSQDHHSSWVNSRALEAANITAHSDNPAHGSIVKDETGNPTGMLLEQASNMVSEVIPEPSHDDFTAALHAAAADLASYGVTTVHSMAYEPASYWRSMAKVASRDDYGLRVWGCIPHANAEDALALGVATGQGGDRFRVGGAKFFADGALGSLTAWMLEPYAGSNDTGVQIDDPATLAERFPVVIEAGLTPVTHAIGDAANRAVLDALEATRDLWQARNMRPRIEHAQHLHPDDVPRFGKLGVIASVQPFHMVVDAPNAREIIPQRLERAYPFASLLTSGATLIMGSDTPVAVPGVLKAIRAAVNRIGADGKVFQEHERLSVQQVLHGYTRAAAYAINAEHRSGQLKAGFDADFVVLSEHPLTADIDALEVCGTMLAGKWTKPL